MAIQDDWAEAQAGVKAAFEKAEGVLSNWRQFAKELGQQLEEAAASHLETIAAAHERASGPAPASTAEPEAVREHSMETAVAEQPAA